MNYFQQNKSDVYVLLLDATKTFDKVNYAKLFYLLYYLLYMYTNQHLNVSWINSMSLYFSTTNGVKQGVCYPPFYYLSILMKC